MSSVEVSYVLFKIKLHKPTTGDLTPTPRVPDGVDYRQITLYWIAVIPGISNALL